MWDMGNALTATAVPARGAPQVQPLQAQGGEADPARPDPPGSGRV